MFNRHPRKQRLKFFNVKSCKELFGKVFDLICISEVFFESVTKAAVQIAGKHNCMNGQKRSNEDAPIFCDTNRLTQCLRYVFFLIEMIQGT